MDPTSHRPISSLPAVGKLTESLQSEVLCRYLVTNKIISDHRFGFLPGISTTTQLVYLVDKCIKSLEKENGAVAVFMDFMKAFDKVWHSSLLYKLVACGIEVSPTPG